MENNNCTQAQLAEWAAKGNGFIFDWFNKTITTYYNFQKGGENSPVVNNAYSIKWFGSNRWLDPTVENIMRKPAEFVGHIIRADTVEFTKWGNMLKKHLGELGFKVDQAGDELYVSKEAADKLASESVAMHVWLNGEIPQYGTPEDSVTLEDFCKGSNYAVETVDGTDLTKSDGKPTTVKTPESGETKATLNYETMKYGIDDWEYISECIPAFAKMYHKRLSMWYLPDSIQSMWRIQANPAYGSFIYVYVLVDRSGSIWCRTSNDLNYVDIFVPSSVDNEPVFSRAKEHLEKVIKYLG